MSWHFSLALVEEYLRGNCLDGDAYALSSGSHTPQVFSQCDRMMDFCQHSQSGMMCEPLTDDLGEAVLTWFLGDSPAKTLAELEQGKGLKESEAGYGAKWQELYVRYDQSTHSWKTHRCLWEEDLPWFLVTLPKWGLMQNGVCWELTKLEHRTRENAAGLWPTPVKTDGFAVGWCLTSIERKEKGECRPSGAKIGSGLKYFRKTGRYLSNGYPNPALTEWLMGWPIRWTDLQPQATDKSHNARRRHGAC